MLEALLCFGFSRVFLGFRVSGYHPKNPFSASPLALSPTPSWGISLLRAQGFVRLVYVAIGTTADGQNPA